LTIAETDNSACLVEAARDDRTAFAQLFRRHYDEIFRYCARRLTNRETAEDITSAVFLKMVNNFDTFRGDDDGFRVWLYRIATNEINSYFRKVGRHARFLESLQHQPPQDDAPDLGIEDDNRTRIAQLHQAMARLKPAYRDIVALRYFQGLNSEEIGKILGAKPVTVRSKLARALRMIEKEFRRGIPACGADEPL
jgi:RNA polymerase sigma-70 factor (ECF subfamily)